MDISHKHTALMSVLETWQSMVTSSISIAHLNFVVSNVITSAVDDDVGEDTMFFFYFEIMDQLDRDEFQWLMHPGRGHPRFGECSIENPLPKLNVCRFYKMIPAEFQRFCGLTPSEFDSSPPVTRATKRVLPCF